LSFSKTKREIKSEIIPDEENFLPNSEWILSSSASFILLMHSGQTTGSFGRSFLLQDGQNLGRKKSKNDVKIE